MSQPETATVASTMNAYPTTQVMDVSANNANSATEQLQKEDAAATSSMLRLRGGGCVKDCLATICCCCALEAICCCEIDEICC